MKYLMFLTNSCSAEGAKVCVNIAGPNGLPGGLANLIHYGYLILQVAVPIILIIMGMITFAKAITSQKEDEIKAAQSSFFKKLIIAVVIFLVLTVVHLIFNMVGGNNDIWGCVEKLLDGNCS